MEAFSRATGKPVQESAAPRLRNAFAGAAAKPEGSGNKFLEAILDERPDLVNEIAYFPQQGNFGYTVIIGNEVFKGPRHSTYVSDIEQYVREFENEAEVLRELEGKGLPVPRVTCSGKNAVFFGMSRMPGVTLDRVMRDMSKDELKELAGEVAGFVVAMARALPRENGLYALQGDLREPNILVDEKTKKLSGIIDFGMACNVTKQDLVPRWISNPAFKRMVEEALESKKYVLPKSPEHAKSQYVRTDPALSRRF